MRPLESDEGEVRHAGIRINTAQRPCSIRTHNMSSNSAQVGSPTAHIPVLLTSKETAKHLKVSSSWLAKARMRGDGPPYIKMGRAIRYNEAAILQWVKSRQRLSTSEA